MVARGNEDYELIGNTDDLGLGYMAYANRDNFEYGGEAGGADAARQQMFNQSQNALTRGGPAVNYSQADADLANAMAIRDQQDV